MSKSRFTGHYDRFRALLVQARRQSQYTQQELAVRLNKPQSFVSKYERGERRLDVVEFLEIADVLGVDPSQFLYGLARKPQWRSRGSRHGTIVERWDTTVGELTGIIDENPSLRGMVLGYLAETKLRQMWLSGKGITYVSKQEDHDRQRKGDHVITYKGRRFVVEAKSLQTNTVFKDGSIWRGKAQVDASDRRQVGLPDGRKVNTTLLLVGEFDLLAVSCFAFENTWRFVFAKNSELPRSCYHKYPPRVRKHLLASLVAVSWPPEPPFHPAPYRLLDEILRDREGREPR